MANFEYSDMNLSYYIEQLGFEVKMDDGTQRAPTQRAPKFESRYQVLKHKDNERWAVVLVRYWNDDKETEEAFLWHNNNAVQLGRTATDFQTLIEHLQRIAGATVQSHYRI